MSDDNLPRDPRVPPGDSGSDLAPEPPDPEAIRSAVRKRYGGFARTSQADFAYPTGRAGAESLGYDRTLLDALPAEALSGFCGVGNPFSLGEITAGESVLDAGCGAGIDLLVASMRVGPRGRVCGFDLTPEMVARARENARAAAATNMKVVEAPSEEIPYEDSAFDVVISNGVLNLSPRKEASFREIFRVLRPGGRLQFADIVLRGDLPEEVARDLDAWSQ